MSTMMRNLAWTAGFLEGDGSFSVSGADPRVSATQVELEPLNRLLSLHGGAIYPHKPAGFGKKKGHAWVLRGGKGIGLMMTLYPFMCSRRQRQIKKTILDWLSRGVTKGERHHLSTVSDVDALAAMRHVRDGRSVEVVAGSLGISRHILSYWMQGTKRSYLLKALEKEGIPSKYVYNGGRREPRHLNKEIILEAIRRVRRGESNTAVARDLDVTQGVVSLWCSGKNRPYLLEQVLEEEREALEEE